VTVRGFAAILAGAWRVSPPRLVVVFALVVLNYASWPLAPLVMKRLTDAVVAGDLRAATIAALFLPLLALLTQTGAHVSKVLLVELADLNVIEVTAETAELAQGSHGLAHLERADYADELELIRNEGAWRYNAVRSATGTVGLAIQLVLTVVLLARLEPVLLLLLAFAVPPLLGTRWSWRRFDRYWLGSADRMRRATHLVDLALRADAAKEVRVFGLEEELGRRLHETRTDLRRTRFRVQLEGVVAMSVGHLVFALGYVGALLVVVRGAVDGSQTAGDVVLAVALAAQANRLVFNVVEVTQTLQWSARAVARVSALRRLVRSLYPPRAHDAPVPARLGDAVRFEGVTFRYPGTPSDALRDVDLVLPAGSTVALVGENGAGKTTLVKLLCRFYEPTEGRLTVDGVDLARMAPEAWRAQIAAGFQDFVRFEVVARESVGVGDLAAIDDRRAVTAAIGRAAAGDVIETLPNGLEALLGATHGDGVELSGGQWQKIALARAMMRERPLLLILDEPTSALDAHAEHELFERYAASARAVARATGAIAVFVSHRFSTVRMADVIVVVDAGRIAEQGTHDQLVARGGIYADLFALQAAAYR
jgi:ATP-binding cassette subfamily B protein